MDIGMDQPGYLSGAAEYLGQELQGNRESPSPIVLVEHQGMRDAARLHHRVQGLPNILVPFHVSKIHHTFRTAV